MSISDAMLAQSLLDYFEQHTKEFEDFLIERFRIDDGYVAWREDKENKRLLLTVTKKAQGGETLSQRDYAISVETVMNI
jgi:hypothetical protein